mgnify:CR=1 FL=1
MHLKKGKNLEETPSQRQMGLEKDNALHKRKIRCN